MKYIIILLTLSGFSFNIQAQYDDAIKADLKIYSQAFLEGDYDKYVNYSIQSVIQMGGGAELMKDVAKEQAQLVANSNSKMLSLEPTWISEPYQSEGAIHVVVGQQLKMEIGTDVFVKTAYYLAESVDEGKSWSFIDLEPYSKEALAAYIPGISSEIVLPEADAALKAE